jgi:hypothetical protein
MPKTGASTKDIPHFLSGWKEIAAYLGKGVRTVQRYERECGLPVRRPARRAKGSVVATKGELDAWVSASPIDGAFQLKARRPAGEAPLADSFYRQIEQMGRLRDQMAALRSEVRASVRSLKSSVYLLQGELNRRIWKATDFPPIAEENGSPDRRPDLASLTVLSRKAS